MSSVGFALPARLRPESTEAEVVPLGDAEAAGRRIEQEPLCGEGEARDTTSTTQTEYRNAHHIVAKAHLVHDMGFYRWSGNTG